MSFTIHIMVVKLQRLIEMLITGRNKQRPLLMQLEGGGILTPRLTGI